MKRVRLLVRSCVAVASLLVAAASVASNPSPSQTPPSAPWLAENSPEPQPKEWEAAERFQATRATGARATACFASRVREWLRVRCPALRVSAITQLGGETNGTRFAIDAPSKDDVSEGGEVVLPLRPKQRRVVMFWSLGRGYDGPLTVVPGVVLQTDWSDGAPRVVLHDAVHEPVRTAQSERRAKQEQEPAPQLTW
ncbi:MAG: hypothetical protein QM756_14080 [Polyangiaceae bacterium]